MGHERGTRYWKILTSDSRGKRESDEDELPTSAGSGAIFWVTEGRVTPVKSPFKRGT